MGRFYSGSSWNGVEMEKINTANRNRRGSMSIKLL